MTDRIEPALTAEEWSDREHRFEREGFTYYEPFSRTAAIGARGVHGLVPPESMYAPLIAALNHCLPDSDPRKITREWIAVLRAARDAGRIEGGASGDPIRYAGRPLHFGEQLKLQEIADALESYLPPERQ